MLPEPRRIHPLPPQLANQIAAGEVVERPASVVKELVENSLDAGADEILVEAEEGGVRLLRVRDNGGGIHRDDLSLALSRHATSKISDPRDLLGIVSLGFRGEALASIASVARLRLTSRMRDAESAWSVAGESDAPAPASHPLGTTVEVRDLFHNLPARRKFLRAERTEYEHLEEVVRRLALGNFKAGFTLRHNGRAVFSVPRAVEAAAQERRLSALAGRPFLEHAAAIEFEAAGLRLRGWIGAGGYTRSQADVQYVYLNGRAVRDRVVSHALRQAFNDVLSDGRFPAYVLYLEMDPAQVDVNVHPTKHEVRFREARLVHDFLVSAVRSALGETAQWTAPLRTGTAQVAEGRGAYEALQPSAAVPSRDTERHGERRRFQVVANRFLVTLDEERMVLVDGLGLLQQEARAALQTIQSGEIAPRPLLIPVTVRVGAQAAGRAEAMAEQLRRCGIDLQPVSAEAVRLFAVPDIPFVFDAARLASAVLAERNANEPALHEAIVQAVTLPASEPEKAALLERATPRHRATLDEERLARLMREGT